MQSPANGASGRDYDAIVLDLDGTLVADDGHVRPGVRAALRRAMEAGVVVMVATGRSEAATRDVARELGVAVPCIVYNGAGMWCPTTDALLEERLLSNRAVERTYRAARELGLAPVAMTHGLKVAEEPVDERLRSALSNMTELEFAPLDRFPTECLIRITLMSTRYTDSAVMEREINARIGLPVYTTHFPLNALAPHRNSTVQVVDVQPPCRGKGEALRYLSEVLGIEPARVVAVGDAGNDVPMFTRAGLGVAMGNAMPAALAAAERVIGDCNTDAIAELVAELFRV
jgi:5-amino-6-(5-phospho-D-ribitylamino)uracil phosphatase